MKNKILTILFLISAFITQAQTKFGFTAGAQLSNVRIINYNTDNRLGFNVGLSSLTPVTDGVDFNMQLVLSGKGYIFYDSYGYKNIIRPLYLELPLTFRFNFQSSTETKIFIGAGGYFAYGIGGNKIYYISGYKETESINFGDTFDDDFESTDLGLVFQLGAKFRENYEGQFFYDMGLKKIVPNTTSNSFNRVFGFNLTWYF
jgi:hypothetical protein